MKMWKRMLALCLCLCALLPFAAACAEGDAPEDFMLEHGSREKKMVALTVDDCYYNRRERIVEDVALCNKYGVHMTFFPVVKTGCLVEKCREGGAGQDAGLPLPDPVAARPRRDDHRRAEALRGEDRERPEALRL